MKSWDPEKYDAWYRTPLGKISDGLEKNLLFSMTGVKEGERALDAGCGTGIYSIELAGRGARVTGLDNSGEMLSSARTKAAKTGYNINFIQADALRLPFPDKYFDLVLSVNMLCFLKEPEKALTEMSRVLRPGGRLIIGLLNKWSPWALLRRIKGFFKESIYNKAVFISPPEAELFLKSAGFDVKESKTCLFFLPVNCGLYLKLAYPFERLDSIVTPRMGAFLSVLAVKAHNKKS